MAFKRWLALLLALLLVVSLLPAVYAGAAEPDTDEVWARITALEDKALGGNALAKRARADGDPTAADFAALSEDVETLVVNSGNCVPGSVIRHGSFFYWTALDGEVCGYSPALRAKMRASSVDPDADPEALSGVETVSFAAKGGTPGSVDVAVFQPYYGLDSSFKTTYSDEGKRIAQTLGGTSTTYKTSAGTIDKLAESLETCAVVILDSHGDTDYYNPNNSDDFVTQANTSYLCMQTNAGWTAEDQKLAQGPYGSYYHAYNGGSSGSTHFYCVDGTAIANHMQGSACNNLLWAAICLGMATDGIWKPVREKGVEVVYGYSQSVSFSGDYEYEAYFWDHMIDDYTVGESFAYMKEQANCNWDPAYSNSYSLAKARYNFVAFPNVVSSEDEYQGHRTVNPRNANDSSANQNHDPAYGACNIQTVLSNWTLVQHYVVTAVSANEDWGTVSVAGGTITASPAEGYYAAGFEILSGEASVVQNGNTFIVTAQSDCTVQIDFAPKTPATVTFLTPDGVACEPIATYLGDEITLPAPEGAPTSPAQSVTFLGWTDAPVEDTTDKPAYQAAGAAWRVDAEDREFYALYTYTDDSMVEFTRLDRKPANWSGEYVITYNSEVVLDASGAFTGEQLGSSDAAIAFADTGMTLDGDRLLNVPDDYIYVFEPSASIEGTYTIRMKGSENYLSCKKDAPLFASGTVMPYNSNWQAIWVGDVAAIKNSAVTQKYLQYDTNENAFCCAGVATMNLTLYRGSDGTAHYTTEVTCEHDYVAVVTEPTCTEGGFTTYTCSKCGDSYVADETGALGHDYQPETTAPTCIEGGFTTYTCARCGDSYAADEIAALGHDYQPEVTAPTCTEGGFTTYTCARCGDSYVADEIAPLGHDWNEPVYAWAVDYSAVTAIRTCKNDESHVETEDGTIASEVTREATIDAAGEIVYTATFTNPAFETQTLTVAVPKLDDGLPCDGGETCQGSVFTDMPAKSDWAHDAIDWAFVHGVTSGTTSTTFSPNEGCTRAQVVTFLWRAAGSPEPAESRDPFGDVTESAYYCKAVLWAVENGITTGTDAGKFSPDDTCTRAQIVTFLWRAAGSPEPTVLECALTDVSPMDYYYKAVLWAAENGVTQGTGPSTFGPLLTCTRAQVVTFLWRSAAD